MQLRIGAGRVCTRMSNRRAGDIEIHCTDPGRNGNEGWHRKLQSECRETAVAASADELELQSYADDTSKNKSSALDDVD